MKIGLVTIHRANSYGGVLQAYATKRVLSQYGEVFVIDHVTPHLRKTLELIRIADGPRGVLRVAKDISRLLPRRRLIGKFNRFCEAHFEPFLSMQQALHCPDLDLAVAGSDQIWNPKVTGGLDPAYFLSRVNAKRKISLSTSFGSHEFSTSELSEIKAHLASISHIAVREEDSAMYLSRILGRHVARTIDPTLMLDMRDWESLASVPEFDKDPSPYLLVYSLGNCRILSEVVNRVSRARGLRVVVINQDPFVRFPVNNHLRDLGPEEYLRWFMGAELVVTNSFHGTAFACNFSKPFLATPPVSGVNRIRALLRDVELTNRLVESGDDYLSRMMEDIDWDSIARKLSQLRLSTRAYIEGAVFTDADADAC